MRNLLLASCVGAVIAAVLCAGVHAAPAPLDKDLVALKLPAAVDECVAGGSGRYLILRLAKLRKLAVFDVSEAKITQYISLDGDNVLYAAGSDKLVVALLDQSIVQRWSLTTFKKELAAPLPPLDKLDGKAMGYASAGPALLRAAGGPAFLDVVTLRLQEVRWIGPAWGVIPGNTLNVRASADGSTFAARESTVAFRGIPRISMSRLRLLTLEDGQASSHFDGQQHPAGAFIPGMDGSLLFTGGAIYTSDLKPLESDDLRRLQCFPSYDPNYFLAVNSGDDVGAAGPRLSVHLTEGRRRIATLSDLPELAPQKDTPQPLTPDQHIHLFPGADLLVTISTARDELVLRRFVVSKELDKAGFDYLFVGSLPPRQAKAGEAYLYPIEVKSKRGGVKYALETGPDGMTCASDGTLLWRVPADYRPGAVAIILAISDGSGQQIRHSFVLKVR